MFFEDRGGGSTAKRINVTGVHTEGSHLGSEPPTEYLRCDFNIGLLREFSKLPIYRWLGRLEQSIVIGVSCWFEFIESLFRLLVVERHPCLLHLGLFFWEGAFERLRRYRPYRVQATLPTEALTWRTLKR